MASSKKKTSVDDYLSQEAQQGMIRRGAGMRLSTETVPQEELSHNRTIAPEAKSNEPVRVNRGYKLREDLIKQCKRIALEEDRNLYEVMEEALEQYLERKRTQPK